MHIKIKQKSTKYFLKSIDYFYSQVLGIKKVFDQFLKLGIIMFIAIYYTYFYKIKVFSV